MSFAKVFCLGSLLLFGAIGVAAWKKQGREQKQVVQQEIVEVPVSAMPAPTPVPIPAEPEEVASQELVEEPDRIDRLFSLDPSYQLPIVETVSFTSRVPWLKERPAWVADYASHFETSRHFIARCLNHGPDYFSQKVSHGARFNVFRKDKKISFHCLVDLSRCLLFFSYIDQGTGEMVRLKTYRVTVGRKDPSQASLSLTPIGKYSLGDRVAIYKPGTMALFRDQKREMVGLFGTRWLPFGSEVEGCTKPAKGFGLQGIPWSMDKETAQPVEDRSQIGSYSSNGCIWLLSEDIEELFAIVLTKPTIVEIVK